MSTSDTDPPVEAQLVAYLDGALGAAERNALKARLAGDAGLRARLERLRAGGRDFAAAFDALLQSAPQEKLAAILAQAESAAARGPSLGRHRAALRAAAAIVLLLIGAAAGHFIPRAFEEPGEEVAGEEALADGWRQVVAEYLTLYTGDTLADIPDDPALRGHELAAAGARLALDLDPVAVALPDLDLKRAQVFALDGKPLVQIAYLSAQHGPLAFCIIADGAGASPRAFEQRLGSNIVYWSQAGRSYMLIGKAPRPTLEVFADTLAQRLS